MSVLNSVNVLLSLTRTAHLTFFRVVSRRVAFALSFESLLPAAFDPRTLAIIFKERRRYCNNLQD